MDFEHFLTILSKTWITKILKFQYKYLDSSKAFVTLNLENKLLYYGVLRIPLSPI